MWEDACSQPISAPLWGVGGFTFCFHRLRCTGHCSLSSLNSLVASLLSCPTLGVRPARLRTHLPSATGSSNVSPREQAWFSPPSPQSRGKVSGMVSGNDILFLPVCILQCLGGSWLPSLHPSGPWWTWGHQHEKPEQSSEPEAEWPASWLLPGSLGLACGRCLFST